jgi:hypothetical protein
MSIMPICPSVSGGWACPAEPRATSGHAPSAPTHEWGCSLRVSALHWTCSSGPHPRAGHALPMARAVDMLLGLRFAQWTCSSLGLSNEHHAQVSTGRGQDWACPAGCVPGGKERVAARTGPVPRGACPAGRSGSRPGLGMSRGEGLVSRGEGLVSRGVRARREGAGRGQDWACPAVKGWCTVRKMRSGGRLPQGTDRRIEEPLLAKSVIRLTSLSRGSRVAVSSPR